MTGLNDAAMRDRTTPAMLCQFKAEDTLVPPNLSTTQARLGSSTAMLAHVRAVQRRGDGLIVFENIAQFFFQLPLGEHVFHATPSGLAALADGGDFGAPLGALQQGIEVVRFFGFPEKLLVDIEMFVFAFAHWWRKALEINRIDKAQSLKLRTIADSA